MILSELKTYLMARKRSPLSDLANHFNADPDAVRGMLAHFMHKGQVRRIDDGAACGGCQKCDAYASEAYEWTGR